MTALTQYALPRTLSIVADRNSSDEILLSIVCLHSDETAYRFLVERYFERLRQQAAKKF
ncbi:MAG: hypothetical protein HC821_02385 [Lewinella sp.]|nr:hypothetical protein [Lewinella sp.]